MSKYQATHPGDGVLLGYLDGELPAREAHDVERHIEACWPCRTEVEELDKTVAECVRYRKHVMAAHLPPPPRNWCDLYSEMERADAAAESLFARIFRPLPGSFRWAATAVAAAALVVAIVYQWRETPSVKAATLLKRAVAAADTRAQAPRQIRIRTKTMQGTRTIGANQPVSAAIAPVQSMFQSAHYDWADPLSARAFQSWRESVAQKSDEVTAVEDRYQIRTTASDGELSSATLTLRTADLRPVEERLEFRNQDWVELSEITEPSGSGGNVAAVEAPVRPAEPSRPAAVAPGPSASISDELQVLAALHQIEADLGDPVEVKISEGRVLVSGVGIPNERQKQIRSALAGMSNVAVQFADPSATPALAEPQAPASAGMANAPPGKVQARIEQQLGGRAEFERFSSQMLDATESAMSRTYALRALAQRFSARFETALSSKDREVLRELAGEHAAALASQVAALQHAIGPVLAGVGARPRTAEAGAANWQSAADDLYRAGRRFEMLLSVTLGVTPAAAQSADLPGDLSAALAELRAGAERCRYLLSQ